MSYKIRNSIVLGVLLLLTVGIGTYVRAFHLPKQLDVIQKEIGHIDEELSNTPSLINEFNTLSATVTDTKQRWESRSKEIPAEDVTGQTYQYFSSLIEKSDGLKLNMVFGGAQVKGNYGFNVYNLHGEGKFPNIYKFIWYLENGRKLFKVSTLSMKGFEVAATEKNPENELLVTFDMSVQAFFAAIPDLAKPAGVQNSTPNYLVQNPFEPVVTANLPPNNDDLVEVERSDLKAVIAGKAFVIDQNQKFRTLEPGDEVYLGYVTNLSADEGRIECTLNKGGIIERIQMKIRYTEDKPSKQLLIPQQAGMQ